MTGNNLQDFTVNVRIKLSALWTSLMFCYIYGDYFQLYVPGKVPGLINGKNMLDTPLKLFAASVMLAIPALMIFLSLVVRPKLCKFLNVFFGSFFTLLMLAIAVLSLTDWLIFYVFLAIVESVLSALIVGYAWTWLKAKEQVME